MRSLLAMAGRWSIILGAVVAASGSLMPWVDLPMLGVVVPVSGLFSLGMVTFALSLLVAYLRYRGYRLRLLYLAIAASLLWVSGLKIKKVKRETHTTLLQMEMRLYPLNQAIAQLGAPPVSVFDTGRKGDDFVGVGLQVMPVGAGIILVGCLFELLSRPLSLKSLPLEFVGFLACSNCATLLRSDMLTCPRCGKRVSSRHACWQCYQALDRSHRFCFRCGARAGERGDG